MTKIAVAAFSDAVQFTKREWRGIMLLALKTYGLIFLFQILASIPSHIMMRPEDAMNTHTSPINLSDLPTSLLMVNMIIAIIGFFLSQWVISPMYISISRSVVLGVPFDRILCARLTEPRTVRVAKLIWSMAIIVIPFYAILFGMISLIIPMAKGGVSVPLGLIIVSILIGIAYTIFFFYVMLRINYLIPAFACDRQFSSLSEIWGHSRGKAWSVFKVTLLGMLFYICIMLVFIAAFVVLSALLAAISHMVFAGKMALQILIGITFFLLFLFMIGVMILLLPQLITASIASVYKLSQAKT